MTDRYQFLPPLTDDEYAALKADITENGVLVPIVYDQNGDIIDGHHRAKIAAELGIIDVPTKTVEIDDEEHGRRLARVHNLARRHLSRQQRRQLIAEEITADPDRSDRAIGRLLGVDHKTVGSVRRELAGEVPHHEEIDDEDRADAERITTEIGMRIDAFGFALLSAMHSGVAPATIIGWLTTAKHNLVRLGGEEEFLAESVCRRIIEPCIYYLVEHGDELAGPDGCVEPLTDEEIADLGRAISGGALLPTGKVGP